MRTWSAAILAVSVGFGTACSRDPEVAKREYVTSGDKYAKAEQLPQAIIEYRNAIALDPRFGEARLKYADTLAASGDGAGALREYARAADLMPKDIGAQLRSGQMHLLAKQYREARARAEAILEVDPKNVSGLILLGNAMAGLKDFAGAVTALEEAIDKEPEVLTYANLGAIQAAQGDTRAAESTFKRAVTLQPGSADAHWSLGNYYWAARRTAEAETEFKAAYAINPKSPVILRGLAGFYLANNQPAEAESYFKAYAAGGDMKSKLALADFYVGLNRLDDVAKTLEPLARTEEGFVPATTRLATLHYANGKRDQAYADIDSVLKKEPKNPSALLAKAEFLIRDGKPADALPIANDAVALAPTLSRALLTKAVAERESDATPAAIKTLQTLLSVRPSEQRAQIMLAELYIRQGNSAAALELLGPVVKAQPRSIEAHLLRAKAAIVHGDLTLAESETALLARAKVEHPDVAALQGSIALRKGDVETARKAYTAVLQRQPNNTVALMGLIRIDLAEHKAESARGRIESLFNMAGRDTDMLLLAAVGFGAIGDDARAEAAYQKALASSPGRLDAYMALAHLYMKQNRLEEARQHYEDAAAHEPQMAAPSKTFIAIILGLQGKPDEARNYYKAALAADPQSAVAANNLAWDYAERGGDLNEALQLAQTAKAALPNDPRVNDTLGWVFLKRGLPSSAVTYLSEASKQAPTNAGIQYRLGLAYLQLGDKANARTSFERALTLNPKFEKAEDAKRELASLRG